jgi:hypothetical protein
VAVGFFLLLLAPSLSTHYGFYSDELDYLACAKRLALGVMASPGTLAVFSMFTVNCTGILLWTAASWILLELCRSRNPRLWLALGVVLGVALLNKHTALVPIAGVAVGTLLTPTSRPDRGVPSRNSGRKSDASRIVAAECSRPSDLPSAPTRGTPSASLDCPS